MTENPQEVEMDPDSLQEEGNKGCRDTGNTTLPTETTQNSDNVLEKTKVLDVVT